MPDLRFRAASILCHTPDLGFCLFTCVALVGIVYWPSNPHATVIYTPPQRALNGKPQGCIATLFFKMAQNLDLRCCFSPSTLTWRKI